jgi:hypothetical protein
MKKLFGNLIILSPTNGNIMKFRFTPTAIMILVLTCFLSFGAVVAIGYTVPPRVRPASEQRRLEEENMELKISNKNAALGVSKLAETTDRMEAQSKRILDLIDTE